MDSDWTHDKLIHLLENLPEKKRCFENRLKDYDDDKAYPYVFLGKDLRLIFICVWRQSTGGRKNQLDFETEGWLTDDEWITIALNDSNERKYC